MPLSLANRFQATLLGSCLGPMSLSSGSHWAGGNQAALQGAAIAPFLWGAQTALGLDESRDATGMEPSIRLASPLQHVFYDLPGLLLSLNGPCPGSYLPASYLEVYGPNAMGLHQCLRGQPLQERAQEGTNPNQAIAEAAFRLVPSQWELAIAQVWAIAQAQSLAGAQVEAAAGWLGSYFGATHGLEALPWRSQQGWEAERSQLLALGGALYRHWSGQAIPQESVYSRARLPIGNTQG